MPLFIKYTKIREKNQVIWNKKSLVHKNACIEKRSWQKFCNDNIKLLSVGFFKILIFTASGFFISCFFTNIYSYIYWKNPKRAENHWIWLSFGDVMSQQCPVSNPHENCNPPPLLTPPDSPYFFLKMGFRWYMPTIHICGNLTILIELSILFANIIFQKTIKIKIFI